MCINLPNGMNLPNDSRCRWHGIVYQDKEGVCEDILFLPAKPVVRKRVKTNGEWHSIEDLHSAPAKWKKRK
ncbi:hypothetical protein DYB31_012408 [Aphanomyces astaci]|uniref:Rieske domain-containing protein n=1 Tax=Aphanomyces astaci TaxID=112090 RepID=A0A397FUG3_APHAT|nr:hypothetical protein DYB31_012408 [Aphanomyces astaci]